MGNFLRTLCRTKSTTQTHFPKKQIDFVFIIRSNLSTLLLNLTIRDNTFLSSSWSEPLGHRSRVPARACNMRYEECCRRSFITVSKSSLNLFVFICFHIFCCDVWGARVKRKLICQARRSFALYEKVIFKAVPMAET